MNNIFEEFKNVLEVIQKQNCNSCNKRGLFEYFLHSEKDILVCEECNRGFYMDGNDLVYGFVDENKNGE